MVTSEIESTSSGSITVPVTFASSHDAFAVYLTPGFSTGFGSTLVNHGSSLCMDENDWTTVVRRAVPAVGLQQRDQPGIHFVPVTAGSSTYFISR